MLDLDYQQVYSLIARGEGETLDFKHSITSVLKIAKAIAAFANHKGGLLLVGVKDNGKIAKINTEEEIYMLEAAVEKCKPRIDFEIQEITLDGRSILAMKVEPGQEKPYLSLDENNKWLAYVRVKDSNVLANWIWLQVSKNQVAKKNLKLEYHGIDETVLKFIAENPLTTQRAISKGLKLNFRKVGQTLVKLVGMGIILMDMSKDGVFFSAK